MNALFLLWAMLVLTTFAGWCLWVVFSGLAENAPLELRVTWWIGRIILVLLAIALLISMSKGLLILMEWAIRDASIP